MPTIKAGDGTPLHYAVHDYTDRWRKAETIILIHGFARSGEFWFNMVPYLARFYRVICPDLRGLGQSTPLHDPAHALSLAAYIGDIEAVADHAGAAEFSSGRRGDRRRHHADFRRRAAAAPAYAVGAGAGGVGQ